jgi:hypothetical protein
VARFYTSAACSETAFYWTKRTELRWESRQRSGLPESSKTAGGMK